MKSTTIVKWADQYFEVEVSDGETEEAGVRIYPCDKNGLINEYDRRGVFVDPHAMMHLGMNILQVHAYTNDKRNNKEDGVPVTLDIYPDRIALVNDGKETMKVSVDMNPSSWSKEPLKY